VLEALRGAGAAVEAAPAAGAWDALRALAAAAPVGLTGGDLLVAATGSVALRSGPGRPRAVSLLPPCHVAVVGLGRLVADLEAAGEALTGWARDPLGANVVLVTGPSRTADIELTLTRGVHGPREVHVVLLDG
jgi:L-lactate dehydrogenase complex protein LldG